MLVFFASAFAYEGTEVLLAKYALLPRKRKTFHVMAEMMMGYDTYGHFWGVAHNYTIDINSVCSPH